MSRKSIKSFIHSFTNPPFIETPVHQPIYPFNKLFPKVSHTYDAARDNADGQEGIADGEHARGRGHVSEDGRRVGNEGAHGACNTSAQSQGSCTKAHTEAQIATSRIAAHHYARVRLRSQPLPVRHHPTHRVETFVQRPWVRRLRCQ